MVELTGEGFEEMKKPEIRVAFFLEYGKGCFYMFFFLTGVEVGDWTRVFPPKREAQRDCKSCLSTFPASLLFSIISSLGGPRGGERQGGCDGSER